MRRVSIYRSAVAEENLIAEIPFVDPGDPDYPAPATQDVDAAGDPIPGAYTLVWDVPVEGIPTPDIFFDVWEFIADDCTGSGGGDIGSDPSNVDPCLDDEDLFVSQCCQFWLYPDSFFMDCGLEVFRVGFEALDIIIRFPECRTIEVGMMPLPLYDFNFNKFAPIIPHLRATITIWTENDEVIVEDAPMSIGLRQGSFRSNPFTLQYLFCTEGITREDGCVIPIHKGTYKYRVTLCLPNGETRVSQDFTLQVV
jgi:hypothetical protein